MIKLEGNSLMFSHKRVERIKKASRSTSVTKFRLWGAVELPNGDVRHELFTLGVDNGRDYEPFLNKKTISLACGYFANGKTVVFYPAKGALPTFIPAMG